jgi:hypothetical protein
MPRNDPASPTLCAAARRCPSTGPRLPPRKSGQGRIGPPGGMRRNMVETRLETAALCSPKADQPMQADPSPRSSRSALNRAARALSSPHGEARSGNLSVATICGERRPVPADAANRARWRPSRSSRPRSKVLHTTARMTQQIRCVTYGLPKLIRDCARRHHQAGHGRLDHDS